MERKRANYFSDRYEDIVHEAKHFIDTAVEEKKEFVFYKDDTDDTDFDALCDLPYVSVVGKYFSYSQHAIIKIYLDKHGNIVLDTIGTSDDDTRRTFSISELYDDSQFVQLADMINEQVK